MSTIEHLFAEVYANPDDDQVRRVLADALLATGDPRGELIMLQLDAHLADPTRVMRLIQAHGLTWLGALRDHVFPLAYERGFLASVGLQASIGAINFDHPMWSTVHTIDLEGLDDSEVSAVRITPAMASLKVLIGLTPNQKEMLLDQQPKVMQRLQLILDWRYEASPDDKIEEPYNPVSE